MFNILRNTLVAEDIFVVDNTFATYFTTEELQLQYGVAAYVVTEIVGNTLRTQRLSYVPKNVPVLLERGYFQTEINDEITVNLLRGGEETIVSQITGGTVYVLYNDVFVKSTTGAIPANRAWLFLESQSAPACLFIAGETTDISETPNQTLPVQNAGIFDLGGRRIDTIDRNTQNSKLYIIDGRKVVVNK